MALEAGAFRGPQSAAPEPSHATLEQAAEWYALLCSRHVSEQDRARWQQWLRATPEHQIAWRYVEDISKSFAPLQAASAPRLAADKLLQANARFRQRRRVLAGAAALGGAGMLGWAAWRHMPLPASVLAWAADHRSSTGEQREILMEDGTRIWLNTASAFDVHYTSHERLIALVTGEIFIATAADAQRPLVVETDQGRLRALGTRFNVRREEGHTQVAVYEGAVEIRTVSSAAMAVIAAGQQASFTRDRVHRAIPADAAREAWTHGVLLARDVPLREVMQELRRYRKGYIGLADELAELRVYGSFPVHDTDRTLAMLATALPVRVRQTLPWWVSIEPSA